MGSEGQSFFYFCFMRTENSAAVVLLCLPGWCFRHGWGGWGWGWKRLCRVYGRFGHAWRQTPVLMVAICCGNKGCKHEGGWQVEARLFFFLPPCLRLQHHLHEVCLGGNSVNGRSGDHSRGFTGFICRRHEVKPAEAWMGAQTVGVCRTLAHWMDALTALLFCSGGS